MPDDAATFPSVRERLDEIAQEVAREDISLDEALALYEEAVKLGLSACELSEADLMPEEPADAEDPGEVAGSPEAAAAQPVEPVREPTREDMPHAEAEIG